MTVNEIIKLSVHDMKRNSIQHHGGFRATVYDKTKVVKNMNIDSDFNDERSVLDELTICFFTNQAMITVNSDYEMCSGFRLFMDMYKSNPKCHEAMFGLGRINYIQGRYETA